MDLESEAEVDVPLNDAEWKVLFHGSDILSTKRKEKEGVNWESNKLDACHGGVLNRCKLLLILLRIV